MKLLSDFIQKIKTDKRYFLAIGVIMLLAVSLSFYCLQFNPSAWFDEGIYIQIANNLSTRGQMAVQTAPGTFEPLALVSVGYPVYYTVAFFYKIFGLGFIQARYAAVFFLLLFILSFSALNKKLFSAKTSVLSTLLLISFAPLYGNGKNLLGEIPGLFFMTIGLLGYCQWEKNQFRKIRPALMAGLGFGLAAAAKPNFLVLGGGIIIALILNRRIIYARTKQLSAFLLAGLLPFSWWIYTQFSSIETIKRTLEHYANPYATNNISDLILPNLARFFTESTPLHFSLLALASLAAIYIKIKKGKPISGTEIIIYFFIAFTFISYLRTPGWYRYFFLAHIWLIFLLPESVSAITDHIPPLSTKSTLISAVLIMGIFAAQMTHLTTTGLKCGPNKADLASAWLNQWTDGKKTILLINTPELAARLPHNNYFQYLKINPAIEFGKSEEQKTKTNMYENIVLKATEKTTYQDRLNCYALENETGGYQFYALKKPC